MRLQKQKNTTQHIASVLHRSASRWAANINGLTTPVMFGLTIVGFALYIQLAPPSIPIQTHNTAGNKAVTSSTVAQSQPKAAPPSIPAASAPVPPAVQTAPPTNKASTPVSTPTQTAGTPKPEPVVSPSPSSSVSQLTPTNSPAPATTPAPPTSTQTPSSQVATGYMSSNWSGYMATNGTFTAVSGSWLATAATGNGFTTTADGTWIGIGGVTSSDLIQVGTQNTISASGQVSTSAFYEMLPSVSQTVPGITVSQGDAMTATITQVSTGEWTITITDNTDGQSDTLNVSYASTLSSAEWIEEDPNYSFRRQIPFDNFHSATFTSGTVTFNGSVVTIAASTAQPIIMVNDAGQQVAVPSAIGSDGISFTVVP